MSGISESRVLGLIKKIMGPAAGHFGPFQNWPAAQPYSGFVYADDGKFYRTIQEGVDAATGYVQISGKFSENVVITTDGLTLECQSEVSEIDGGSTGPAVRVEAPDVNLKGFQAKTDNGSTENAIEGNADADRLDCSNIDIFSAGNDGFNTPAGAAEVELTRCRVENCDNRAIDLAGPECRVESCYALGQVDDGIRVQGLRSAITHCYSLEHGNEGIEVEGDESKCIGNTVNDVADNGILIQGDDCVCNGNVVTRSGDDGIRVQGTDDTIVGNRVGGSTNQDIDTSGATTPTTGNNNTGALN